MSWSEWKNLFSAYRLEGINLLLNLKEVKTDVSV